MAICNIQGFSLKFEAKDNTKINILQVTYPVRCKLLEKKKKAAAEFNNSVGFMTREQMFIMSQERQYFAVFRRSSKYLASQQ